MYVRLFTYVSQNLDFLNVDKLEATELQKKQILVVVDKIIN